MFGCLAVWVFGLSVWFSVFGLSVWLFGWILWRFGWTNCTIWLFAGKAKPNVCRVIFPFRDFRLFIGSFFVVYQQWLRRILSFLFVVGWFDCSLVEWFDWLDFVVFQQWLRQILSTFSQHRPWRLSHWSLSCSTNDKVDQHWSLRLIKTFIITGIWNMCSNKTYQNIHPHHHRHCLPYPYLHHQQFGKTAKVHSSFKDKTTTSSSRFFRTVKDQSNYGGETTYNLQDASVSDLSAWLQEVGCALIDLWHNLNWKSNSAIYPTLGMAITDFS